MAAVAVAVAAMVSMMVDPAVGVEVVGLEAAALVAMVVTAMAVVVTVMEALADGVDIRPSRHSGAPSCDSRAAVRHWDPATWDRRQRLCTPPVEEDSVAVSGARTWLARAGRWSMLVTSSSRWRLYCGMGAPSADSPDRVHSTTFPSRIFIADVSAPLVVVARSGTCTTTWRDVPYCST